MSTYLYAQYDGHLRCSSNNVSTDGIKVEFTDKVVILRLGDLTDVWKPSVFSSYCVVCVCVCVCVCVYACVYVRVCVLIKQSTADKLTS